MAAETAPDTAVPRRIALLLSNLELGGAERQAIDFAVTLRKYGWEAVLLVADWRGDLIPRAHREGLKTIRLHAERWRRKGDPRFWINIAQLILRIRQACLRERCPLLQSYLFWENVLAVPAGMLSPSIRSTITCRLTIGGYKDLRPHYRVIENLLNPFVHCVICNSEAVREDTSKRERIDPSRLVVIPNGVDMAHFEEAAPVDLAAKFSQLRNTGPIAGMVANYKPMKRHDLVLRALAMAKETHPGLRVVFIGGEKSDGGMARTRQLAETLGLQDRVVFAGKVPDPAPWLKAMDIGILPSDYEGFPNAVLEYMAAGIPPVVTDISGSREAVIDGQTGLIVPPGDQHALADALSRLAEDTGLRSALGTAARDRARNLYSLERLVENHLLVYEALLRRRPLPPQLLRDSSPRG